MLPDILTDGSNRIASTNVLTHTIATGRIAEDLCKDRLDNVPTFTRCLPLIFLFRGKTDNIFSLSILISFKLTHSHLKS